MRQNLTQPGYESNDLAARMHLTQEGQVTWVDLTRKEGCTQCAHYGNAGIVRGKSKGFGRCALVKLHTKKNGAPYNGKIARACSKFEARQ